MAATDWFDDVNKKEFKMKGINPNVVIRGCHYRIFGTGILGEYNIIEPDKSIENAINKIQKTEKTGIKIFWTRSLIFENIEKLYLWWSIISVSLLKTKWMLLYKPCMKHLFYG